MNSRTALALLALAALAMPARADTTNARCDIYPAGEDHTDVMLACTFSQRQGHVTIRRSDGVTHELSPVGDTPGNFVDENGNAVYRQRGLGDEGLIFRFPAESVYVYWDTAALSREESDNPTYPFSTADYDATTLLRCRATGARQFGTCAAGILRMGDGQASIVVVSPRGEQFTINFLSDVINATNREVDARRICDTWVVTIDGGDVYDVPLAAIEGG